MNNSDMVNQIRERFKIEFEKQDRSGVYGFTQYSMAYNSNRIEGSRLSEDQTAMLFQTRLLEKDDDYRAKDIEEATGHFMMFNKMVQTMEKPLGQKLIKSFHFELKSGVWEDRANGYNIGEYKGRANIVGTTRTTLPEDVPVKMQELLLWYEKQDKSLEVMAKFHCEYESIHPFQDGNGRTGRMILFRECMQNNLIPVVIKDEDKSEYISSLMEYQKSGSVDKMVKLFQKSQHNYQNDIKYFFDNTMGKELEKKTTDLDNSETRKRFTPGRSKAAAQNHDLER